VEGSGRRKNNFPRSLVLRWSFHEESHDSRGSLSLQERLARLRSSLLDDRNKARRVAANITKLPEPRPHHLRAAHD
jgi:hypothetical protein